MVIYLTTKQYNICEVVESPFDFIARKRKFQGNQTL